MKAAFKANSLAVGGLLLCTAMGSAGLGLGRIQGVAFIGQALDVRVPLQLDGSEDIQSACMGAEVLYGESPLDPARVSVTIEPAAAGSPKGTTVRVVSSVLIDEPIVTVNLRAGCEQKLSKRYTLFPEVSTNVVDPVVAVASAKPLPAAATPAPATTSGDLADAASKKTRRAAGPESAVAKTAAPARVAAPLVAPVIAPVASLVRKPAKAAGRSRLKLDPLDLLVEFDPVLRASTELLTLPQENPEKRAEAAAQWRALNASPEDMLRETAQAQSMEKDLKALYAVTAENQKGLMDLVAKVQRAESERYANGLVYTLIALCFSSLLTLAWMWRRSRVGLTPSWRQGWDAGDSMLSDRVLSSEINPIADAQLAEMPVGKISDLAELDFDLGLMETQPPPTEPEVPVDEGAVPPTVEVKTSLPPSVPKPLALPVSKAGSRGRDFSASASGALRAINSEDLLDVRHQAEFFMSLGEHQKAIDVLTARIAQCGESSPLVCLDLLKIYHALGRESDFEFMRTEFNAWFTGQVPEFAAFGAEGRSLDDYPQILNQIVALWPDASVLEYIENCIYHHATDADGPTFDLQAYRDLLLLHAVAKRIVRGPDGGGDSHASELMRIPAQASGVILGGDEQPVAGSSVVHRAGAEHRGVWRRDPPPVAPNDPELELATRGTPLGAMKVPPVVAPPPEDPTLALRPEPDRGPETDFNFLSLR